MNTSAPTSTATLRANASRIGLTRCSALRRSRSVGSMIDFNYGSAEAVADMSAATLRASGLPKKADIPTAGKIGYMACCGSLDSLIVSTVGHPHPQGAALTAVGNHVGELTCSSMSCRHRQAECMSDLGGYACESSASPPPQRRRLRNSRRRGVIAPSADFVNHLEATSDHTSHPTG